MARDYILRLIEQMAAMLAGIVAKEKAGHLLEAKHDLDALCIQTIGLDLSAVKGSSPEALGHRLKQLGGLRHVRSITIAELLLHEMETNPVSPNEPLNAGEVHAFCLLADSLSALSADEQAHYRSKLSELATRLGSLREHPYLEERLRILGPRVER